MNTDNGKQISDERLREIVTANREGYSASVRYPEFTEQRAIAEECQQARKELAEMRTYSHETVRALVDHRDKELLALRASHAELMKALDVLMNLFRDPSLFYIAKLGSPITNGDQDKIDDAFVAAQDALEAARKVGA